MKVVFDTQALLEASDYRGFLHAIYSASKQQSAQFSLAYVASRCGFSSKSFFKDVIDGKKRLSLESANKIARGLNFPSLWRRYFLALVESERASDTASASASRKEMRRLAEKLASQPDQQLTAQGAALFQQLRYWPFVYTALGDAKTGATIADIVRRTRLGQPIVEATLKHLIEAGVVKSQSSRFYAGSNTLFFDDLGESEFFKKFFIQSLQGTEEQARRKFSAEDALFYSMSVSVDTEKMPQLRRELADLLDKFTAEAEAPNGDRVASVTCGFHLA